MLFILRGNMSSKIFFNKKNGRQVIYPLKILKKYIRLRCAGLGHQAQMPRLFFLIDLDMLGSFVRVFFFFAILFIFYFGAT